MKKKQIKLPPNSDGKVINTKICLSEREHYIYKNYAKITGRSFSGFCRLAMKEFMEKGQ